MTDPCKMVYLIKRRADVSREELVAHWFANHMPGVIRAMDRAREQGRPHAWRYIATLFDPLEGSYPWDGMAQLWWDSPPPAPTEPHGTKPADTFQQKAAPYVPWATREHVLVDGELPVEPLTLNDPFPCTRSGFYKVIFLLPKKSGVIYEEFLECWRSIHVPVVLSAMQQSGGFRYCFSESLDSDNAPWAGMAELFFPDQSAARTFLSLVPPDDFQNYYDRDNRLMLGSVTEMIGIP